jgi:Fe2+ transport system protein FeoA
MLVLLKNCKPGSKVIVDELTLDGNTTAKLLGVGLYKTCVLSVVKNAISGVIIDIKNTRLAISNEIAQSIKVKLFENV